MRKWKNVEEDYREMETSQFMRLFTVMSSLHRIWWHDTTNK